ncbi:MAG: glycosyltransferase family 4 protein [Nitrospirae bacterium]|nr:glycosyltransferase family 4 protein [Nitrospirota bacterium]
MRILFCNDYGSRVGGAENYAIGIARALTQLGHEVAWLVSDAAGIDGPVGTVFTCRGHHGASKLARGLREFGNFSARSAMNRAIASFRPDVVHMHCIHHQLSESVLKPLVGVPAVFTAHQYKIICPISIKFMPDKRICEDPFGPLCRSKHCLSWPHYMQAMLRFRLYANDWKTVDRFIAPSRHVERQLLVNGIERVETLLNCIDPSFAPMPRSVDGDTVLFLGRLTAIKGVECLLRAFSEVAARRPSARLVITGDGPDSESFRALATRLGLDMAVHFTGKVQREEVARLCSTSKLLVVPSIWPEPFGLVALEAMASGMPVVASRAGGLQEVVSDGVTGILVKPNDAAELAAGILRVLEDDELRARMEKAALKAVSGWSEAAHVAGLVRIYEQVIAEKSRKPFVATSA